MITNTKPLRILVLLLAVFVWFTEDQFVSSAQAQKNTLYLDVDTVTVSSLPADVFLRVFYRIEAQSPTNFRGYYARLVYGPRRFVRAVDIITSGTASSTVDNPIRTITDDEIRVAALGSIAFDTSNHVLFMIRSTIKADTTEGTTASFLWDQLQLNNESGIDTIIYGDGFVKYLKPELPPRKDTVTVSIGIDSVKAGEILEIPVRVSDMYGANVKQFALNFDFDTSAMNFVGAEVVDGRVPVTRVQQTQDEHATVQIHSLDTTRIPGNSLFMVLRFQTKEREDTMRTYLQQLGFQALNPEATITYVNLSSDTSIIYGVKKPDTTSAVASERELLVRVYPNPSTSFVRFEAEGEKVAVNIFDVLGREIFSTEAVGAIEWRSAEHASGPYLARVRVRGTEQVVLLQRR